MKTSEQKTAGIAIHPRGAAGQAQIALKEGQATAARLHEWTCLAGVVQFNQPPGRGVDLRQALVGGQGDGAAVGSRCFVKQLINQFSASIVETGIGFRPATRFSRRATSQTPPGAQSTLLPADRVRAGRSPNPARADSSQGRVGGQGGNGRGNVLREIQVFLDKVSSCP